MVKKHTVNFTEGSVNGKLFRFALPFYGSMLLQLLFNAADLMVVGRYASHEALAAVGATSSLVHLLINLLMGMSVGTSVVAAQYFGAKDFTRLNQTTHTSMTAGVIAGVLISVVGYFAPRTFLEMMGTPPDVLEYAVVYMRILFLGMPFLQIFNVGSAVLRAVGDTKRPMYILLIAGLFNLLMNMFFVIRCHMDVDGVAYATVLSRILSALMICVALGRTGEGLTLRLRELRVNFRILGRILYIGIPAGIRGSCFSFSNVLIVTSINSFGSFCVAGCSADIALEGMVCAWSGSISNATIAFVGQNFGAKKIDRIKKCVAGALAMGVLGMMILGWSGYAFGRQLISLFNSNPEVIAWGLQRMRIVFLTYFIFNIQDVFGGVLSGMGHSVLNTAIMILGICGFRILWIFFALPHNNTLGFLMLSYPLSWVVTDVMLGVYLLCVLKKCKFN